MSPHDFPRVDRRTAIKWMLMAAASVTILDRQAFSANAPTPSGRGYGTDPVLNRDYKPGDAWPLTFTDAQRRTAAALCAAIIPEDEESPSAASVGVQDFLDEWISAPYPRQQADRQPILDGIAWINTEAQRRFSKEFADLDEKQTTAILDEICYVPDAKPELQEPAKFFTRFRDLTAGGFYTTPAGMKDVKYIGNVPLAEFKGPPPEVLAKLGLA